MFLLSKAGKVSMVVAMFVAVATPAVAQNYRSSASPLTATNGGNDVAYMYGSFVRESVSGSDYLRNNTFIKNPDLDHAVYEETDYYWMNADGYWIGLEVDHSIHWQREGWQAQYDHSRRSSSSYAYGNIETAVKQALNFRPDPESAVEVSKNFWF